MAQVFLRGGKRMLDTRMEKRAGRLFFNFGYSPPLQAEIKCMRGSYYSGFEEARYRDYCKETFGKTEIWSVEDCPRNRFNLKYLMGGDPWAPWDRVYQGTPNRPEARAHQWAMTSGLLGVHYQIWAAQMGTGKTLAWIMAMEMSGHSDWWYVGPKAAITAVERELRKWKSKVIPEMMTYNGVKKRVKEWKEGDKPPHGICFDEFHKAKTGTTETSQACQTIADGIRAVWGDDGYVVGMTGTPAPKSPVDWYSLCEIVYPGFIKEGDVHKFTTRLAIAEKKDGVAGAAYKKLKFKTNPSFCNICGALEAEHAGHILDTGIKPHKWEPSIDEVSYFYQRAKGLVQVHWKDDCMDLPEKVYHVIPCKVTPDNARVAQMILTSTSRAAEALMKLREASDGFQYEEVQRGTKTCDLCKGTGESVNPVPQEDGSFIHESGTCVCCNGERVVPNMVRIAREIPCPKDEALEELLELHEEDGRVVVYAGFEASIDKIERICQAKKWATLRFDGRGVKVLDSNGKAVISSDPIELFQTGHEQYERMVFIGQPGAAGLSLTLTASRSIIYYSNTFKGDDRDQSEDRIHRFGCRGANIYDIVHFPTDRYVLKNLKEKKDLQSISMGDLLEAVKGDRLF